MRPVKFVIKGMTYLKVQKKITKLLHLHTINNIFF